MPHPADLADAAILTEAVRFSVHLRLSPYDKIDRPAASLNAAAGIAAELTGRSSRRPLIYAIASDGRSVPLSRGL